MRRRPNRLSLRVRRRRAWQSPGATVEGDPAGRPYSTATSTPGARRPRPYETPMSLRALVLHEGRGAAIARCDGRGRPGGSPYSTATPTPGARRPRPYGAPMSLRAIVLREGRGAAIARYCYGRRGTPPRFFAALRMTRRPSWGSNPTGPLCQRGGWSPFVARLGRARLNHRR